jgi:hypothetical protein
MNHLPKRPGTVVAAAVLLFIYGAFNLSCSFCAGISFVAGDPNEAQIAQEVPGYQIVNITQAVSNLLTGAAMIALGVGVLHLMPIARIGAFLVCSYEILMALAYTVYAIALVIPATQRVLAAQAQNNPQAAFDVGQLMNVFVWGSLVFADLLALSMCGLIMIFLSGKNVRAAFADEYEGDPRPDRLPRHYDDDDDNPPPSPRSPGDNTGITDRLSWLGVAGTKRW